MHRESRSEEKSAEAPSVIEEDQSVQPSQYRALLERQDEADDVSQGPVLKTVHVVVPLYTCSARN